MQMNRRQFQILGGSAAASAFIGCANTAASVDRSVRIEVEVPTTTAMVFITGNLSSMGPWDPARMALLGSGAKRSITIQVPAGHTLEYKFTLGSWDTEALGDEGQVQGNQVLSATATQVRHQVSRFKAGRTGFLNDPQGAGVKGQLIHWLDVSSQHLRLKRHVSIVLPREYAAQPERRFKVIYAHDGQNLFDPRLASFGIDWGVDEALAALSDQGQIEPHIVVGIWSTTDRRLEYAPNHVVEQLSPAVRESVKADFKVDVGGELLADNYLRFIATELKQRVDATFRTQTGPQNTTSMGSSMGGLISLYALTERADVFGRAACLSHHWPMAITRERIWDGRTQWIPQLTQAYTAHLQARLPGSQRANQKLWIDRGTAELDGLYAPYEKAMVPVLERLGFERGRNFNVQVFEGAAHNEAAWRKRLPEVLAWTLA